MNKHSIFWLTNVFPVILTLWIRSLFAKCAPLHICIDGWRKFHAEPVYSLNRFWWQKLAFKCSLDLYFHPSIIEFRIEEKNTKAVVDVSRGVGGRVFQFFGEKLAGVYYEPVLSRKAVPEDLNMEFRLKFNHGFTNCGSLHCGILSLQGKRYAIFHSKCSKWDFQDFENV